jgi:hypothetical protein
MATPPRQGKAPQRAPAPAPAPPPKSPPPAAAAANPDDELMLQPVHDEQAQAPARRHRPRHMPEPIAGGKALDIGDSSRFLVYGGILVVCVVLATLYYLFVAEKPTVTTATTGAVSKSDPPAPASNTKPASGSPAAAAGAEKKTDASGKPAVGAPPDYTANPANKTCYYAYAKFMSWAYSSALEVDSGTLIEKFKAEVSKQGVTDPQVAEIYDQAIKLLRLSGTLHNSSGTDIRVEENMHGTTSASKNSQEIKAVNVNMRVLNRDLMQRYGQPELAKAEMQAPKPKAPEGAYPMNPGSAANSHAADVSLGLVPGDTGPGTKTAAQPPKDTKTKLEPAAPTPPKKKKVDLDDE